MTLEEVTNVAEILASIGVIISLVYLAVQIRDGARSNRIQEHQNSVGQMTQFMDLLLLNPDLAEIHDRGRVSPGSLTEGELLRFRRLVLRGFWSLSAQHQQFTSGYTTTEEWAESKSIIESYLSSPGVQEWWTDGGGRNAMNREFAEYVDGVLFRIRDK